MCKFFSFVTEPDRHPNERFYFDWDYRKKYLKKDDADSHDHIINYFKLHPDNVNGYEYNPLTKRFEIDTKRNEINDYVQAEKWVRELNFKTIVEPLIIKPIINPFKLKAVKKPTQEQIELLKIWAFVQDSVGASVRDSVGASMWASVRDSVGASMWDSVGASVWAYISTFIDTKYKFDSSSSNKLWESGIVPSFDGTIWRLHSGKKAKIIYEISAKELRKL